MSNDWTEDDIDSLLCSVYNNRIGLFADSDTCKNRSSSNSCKGVWNGL